MTNKTCLDITFNHHDYTIAEVKEMTDKGIVSPADIERIFGKEIADGILRCSSTQSVPHGTINPSPDDSTQIVVWGMTGTCKSCFIAALLSQDGMKVRKDADTPKNRVDLMRGIFSHNNVPQSIPDLSDEEAYASYHLTYKKSFLAKTYPISLIEAHVPDSVLPKISNIVEKEKDQIHIFCLDCRQDVHKQAIRYQHILTHLKDNGYLDNTAGVYILVTRTDRMNAPIQYQDNAAQTLVTSGVPFFWNMVRDICYDKFIYNAQPIPYSSGQFILKDYAITDKAPAAHVFQNALLPKCQPRRNFIGRLLGKGKKWHAVLLGLVFLSALIWGGYKTLRVLEAPPTSPIVPFDYKAGFMEEESTMRKSDYEAARRLYRYLRKDLDAERSLHTANGDNVLSKKDAASCDSALTNHFATMVLRKVKYTFSNSNWSDDENLLGQLKDDIKDLLDHDPFEEYDLTTSKRHIDNYFSKVKPLIRGNYRCSTVSDVDSLIRKAKEFDTYPFSNDDSISVMLRKVPLQAYRSCTNYIDRIVTSLIDDYNEDTSWLQRNPIFMGNRKKRLSTDLMPFKEMVTQLMERLDDEDGYDYNNIKSNLRDIDNLIEKYTFSIF